MNNKTLLDEARILNLKKLVEETKDLPGSILEVGVYKGGSLYEIASIETKKDIYGIDTFRGLPEKTDGVDLHEVGDFDGVEYMEVLELLKGKSNVQLLKGFFPFDFREFNPGPLSLVHIDVDMYQSTKDVLNFADSKLVEGGFIICDDYGAPTCPGARLAVNEFLGGWSKERLQVVAVTNCQISIQKVKK